MTTERSQKLYDLVFDLYQKHKETLLFHGWHHINFVTKKAAQFAVFIDTNVEIVESAALVHDINYIVAPNSEPEAGKDFRAEILSKSGFNQREIDLIENTINESHTSTRTAVISDLGKALSDADSLFKAIPITPIFFSSKYIAENNTDMVKLASKITKEQRPLIDEDIFFYIPEVKALYNNWARVNIELWENMQVALEDADIQEILDIAKANGAI